MADHPLNPPGPDVGPSGSAGHPLLAVQLSALARQLPADVVEELADGLHRTYRHHLSRTGDPDRAARAAVAEFGDAVTLARAFADQSPGRGTARVLLATGPLVGACWAAALVTGHAWAWAVPGLVKAGFAGALIATIAVLARLTFGQPSYRTLNRAAAAASVLVITVDTAMIVLALAVAPAATVPLGLASALSASRLVLTSRRLPALLRG